MGGGAAPPGRYFPDGTWSCIPEDAVGWVDDIAELKAAIEELEDTLANDPPSCRDPDEVRAHGFSPLAAISIWLMERHVMSHCRLVR